MRDRAVTLAILLAAVQLPVSGDWLVTRDGDRIETRGAWSVTDRGVVYTSLGNTFSVLRVEDVDLPASRALTASGGPAGPEAEAAAAPRKPVLVLTDESLAKQESDEEADVDIEAEPEVETTAGRDPVEVVSWATRELRDGGLEVHGKLRNTGAATAAEIRIEVTVRDTEGQILAESRAFLAKDALGPGASTAFRVPFSDVLQFSGEPTFSISSEAFSIGAPEAPGEDDEKLD